MSLSTQTLLGLVLGVAAGLFFGESMALLDPVGAAFIRLLQMTVLPYVVVSLVAGLGSLTYREARVLATQGGLILLGLWAVAFAFVAATPLLLPSYEAGSFFSTTSVTAPSEVDFLTLYIPANPFHSLANAVVPSVVLFSIALGLALIGTEGKDGLLRGLRVLADALMRMATFVVRFTPLGVFAIGASVAGTMTVAEYERIQIYVATYVGLSLVLAFGVLPAVVMAVTPLSYRSVVGFSRDALVTAFATTSEFVVLPILAIRCKELLRRHELDRPESDALIDIVVPASYNFPHAAKVLSLSFVVFAGWFSGIPIEGLQWLRLALAGVATLFASVNLAIPFLLELFRIPEDMFQLYVATGVLNAHFGGLLAAVHILVLTLLVTCARTGVLRFQWRRAAVFAVSTAVLCMATFAGGRALFSQWTRDAGQQGELLGRMSLRYETVPSVVLEQLPAPPSEAERRAFRIDLIRDRGTLRVGYRMEGLPFTFFNRDGALVGFDVEMAHSLGRALGVSIEFVPIRRSEAPDLLDQGVVDVVMAGVPIALELSRFVDFSDPYLDLHLAFLVEDYRRDEFRDLSKLRRREGLRIAALDDPYSLGRAQSLLPEATIVPIPDPRAFLEKRGEPTDAMIYAAEIASAWSLLYPQYSVAVPGGSIPSLPLTYMLPREEPELLRFTNDWIQLKRGDGTIQELYDHWILGRGAQNRGRPIARGR
jgi:Na+/H+-dicarboxylate symporter/ABC-type amino acid transport substrate-binding protein